MTLKQTLPALGADGKAKYALPSDVDIPMLPISARHLVDAFMVQNLDLTARWTLRRIYDAVCTNAEYAVLFRLPPDGELCAVPRCQFESSLEGLQQHFVSTEAYEYAAICVKVLRRHLAQTLIEESRHRE